MYHGRKILAVVPARSGSKGIPHKNMKKIQGKSLIAHAARLLAGLKWLDARVISTDSKAYAAEAKRHGLDAPFLRPSDLSADSSGAVETMQHALRACEEHYETRFDVILIIEPTSPLRTKRDLEDCLKLLEKTGADSTLTVSPLSTKSHPNKIFTLDEARVKYFGQDGSRIQSRHQLSGKYFWRNGLCYALTRECLMEKQAIITDHTTAVVVDRSVSNIDDPLDLEWAEILMRRKK